MYETCTLPTLGYCDCTIGNAMVRVYLNMDSMKCGMKCRCHKDTSAGACSGAQHDLKTNAE